MIGFFGLFADNKLRSLEGTDSCGDFVSQEGISLLVQGLLTGKTPQEILDSYLKTGRLSVDGLEGSFVLVLVDDVQQTVFLYRNLVGAFHTFYAPTPTGFCFGSNLASVARRSGIALQPQSDEEILPTFFLYRLVPGYKTLFNGIFKLIPGELVTWKQGRWKKQQVQTFESFYESHKTDQPETLERIESVLSEVLADWYARKPNSAVLLSGGVDSMLLQVYWNKIWAPTNSNYPLPNNHSAIARPPSASVVLNHPITQGDFDYTMSAVEILNTNHLNIYQEPLTEELMTRVIRQTGLMPSHVQTFYFATLAAGMKQAGFQAGICGEGADGTFGNTWPDDLLAAVKWKQKIPFSFLRSCLASSIAILKPNAWWTPILQLSNHLHDLNYLLHPQNDAGAFTDYRLVDKIFGRAKTLAAMCERRKILDWEAIPTHWNDTSDPYELQRAVLSAFFTEGNESSASWAAMFHLHGLEMYNPYHDSRMIRVASNIRTDCRFVLGDPKQTLKKVLGRSVPEDFIRRPKRGFGQPIFEWLAPGGILRPAVENINNYDWLPNKIKQNILNQYPNWFLWSLLCYDIWYKEFM
jgi:asparagine synthase (glutamine-hydrolysing)